ncbi:MAG: type I-E CRISPR-associated endoribonuclease Cas2 [Anaerolineales bacterium]|nr:type I-E CRISPR-associated endoribonuclease Cas2 [Anaerolineales bacterium]
MIVMILENVPPALRGELSRWLLEPQAGVFVGHLSARVRDKLWDKACRAKKAGSILQIWSTNTEQRFQMRMFGRPSRYIRDLEGLQLIEIPHDLSQKADGSIISKRLKRLAKDATSGGIAAS